MYRATERSSYLDTVINFAEQILEECRVLRERSDRHDPCKNFPEVGEDG